MKLFELIKNIETARTQGDTSVEIKGLAYDSRNVSPGYAFVAIKGGKFDGHQFLGQAVASGASALIVEDESALLDGVAGVVVRDSRRALALMSHAFYGYPTRGIRLVGITGTNGKTTIVYLLESILSAAGLRPGVIGTVNYRFGGKTWPAPNTTPESLDLAKLMAEMIRSGADAVVMEVSSIGIDQSRVAGCEFDAACFTNLTRDHLDYHGTEQAYFEAKRRFFAEILPASESKEGRFSAINLDDPRGLELAETAPGRKITYALEAPGADARLLGLIADSNGIAGELAIGDDRFGFSSQLIGRFNAWNILAAAAVGHGLGLHREAIQQGIAALKNVPGRLEKVALGKGGPLVLVDYAHTPDALERALAASRDLTRGRLISVFGCGGDRDRGKRPLMGRAAVEGCDVAVITSDNPRSEKPSAIIDEILEGVTGSGAVELDPSDPKPAEGGRNFMVIEDRRKAIRAAVIMAADSDTVLIAGKGHEDYQIVGPKKSHFDDREEAARALRRRAA